MNNYPACRPAVCKKFLQSQVRNTRRVLFKGRTKIYIRSEGYLLDFDSFHWFSFTILGLRFHNFVTYFKEKIHHSRLLRKENTFLRTTLGYHLGLICPISQKNSKNLSFKRRSESKVCGKQYLLLAMVFEIMHDKFQKLSEVKNKSYNFCLLQILLLHYICNFDQALRNFKFLSVFLFGYVKGVFSFLVPYCRFKIFRTCLEEFSQCRTLLFFFLKMDHSKFVV